MIKLLNLLYEGPDAPITQRFGNKLILNGVDVYAQYGMRGHNGLDFGIPNGTKLYSCIDGKVIEAHFDAGGYGNYVKIENDDCGVLYAHMEQFNVSAGETVKAGQEIGLSDNTGNSTGPHLHFGVFPKPRDRGNGYAGYIDPLDHALVEWVENIVDQSDSEKIKELENSIANLKLLLEKEEKETDKLNKDKLIRDDKIRKIVKELEEV